jgi:hypothetical protein
MRYSLTYEQYKTAIEGYLKITDFETGEIVPFKLNYTQDKLLAEFAHNNVILKARKEGISTLILAIAIINCNEFKNFNAVFLADLSQNTKKIFERAKDIIKHADIKLDVDIQNEVIIFKKTGSTMIISTAGRKSAFRGSDVHFAHLSEAAFFEYVEVYEAVGEAMLPGAVMFVETTANGRNGLYDLWEMAQGYPKSTNWKPFFFSWADHPSYKLPVTEGFVLTDEEKETQVSYKLETGKDLTSEQLMWRRDKLKSMRDPAKFPQEFPLTASEAFLASGKCIFQTKMLDAMKQTAGDYRLGEILLNSAKKYAFFDKQSGYVRIFKSPEQGKRYVIGADTAEGVEGGDFNAASILDPQTKEQVAEVHILCDPDLFADILNKIGTYYNVALIAPERNMHGFTVVKSLVENYRYPNIYFEEDETDQMYSQVTDKFGFRTNRKTRPLMIDNMIYWIRSGSIKINSIPCINECLSFIRTSTGKEQADKGKKDDRVIALMIACYIISKRDDLSNPVVELPHGKDYRSFVQQEQQFKKSPKRNTGY